MKVEWSGLGERLLLASASCVREAILVAPFVKSATLRKIVETIPENVPILCITRWRLEELANGISDLAVWDIISARGNSRMYLLPQLHAKYYRFDDQVFLGSANVTMAALGWSASPNFEVQVTFSLPETDVLDFEKASMVDAKVVTDQVATEFKALVDEFILMHPPSNLGNDVSISEPIGGAEALNVSYWVPKSRTPELLYQIYSGNTEILSRSGLTLAKEDLTVLDLPSGLSEQSFNQVVGSRLLLIPLVGKLDAYLTVRRRFGEIRQWLKGILNVADATDHWQRLMRWLLFFLPKRYGSNTPNYSEIFWRN